MKAAEGGERSIAPAFAASVVTGGRRLPLKARTLPSTLGGLFDRCATMGIAMNDRPLPQQGRGALSNPLNRFERIAYTPNEDLSPAEGRETVFLRDPARKIITTNDSPDVGFEASINPYRGCEHGCVYCFARPTHEYLGFSAGLDFESRILVKEDAPELLRRELASRRWVPQVIAISGVTDPYQPVERKLGLTRRCLEVLVEARNPVVIITKNATVTRDIDLLQQLARVEAVTVCLSITTLEDDLIGLLEPRTSRPSKRLEAVEELSAAGIPVGALVAPVIPAITDHEIPSILRAVAERGACFASYVLLRLPWTVAPIFEQWLESRFPDRKEKVLNRVREMRGGQLYRSAWGVRQRGEGVLADQIESLFETARRREGLDRGPPPLSTAAFRPPATDQLHLF
jgi:DNA repair photolyase